MSDGPTLSRDINVYGMIQIPVASSRTFPPEPYHSWSIRAANLHADREILWKAFIEKMVKSGARVFLKDGEFVSRNWKLVFDIDAYNTLFGHGSYEPDEIAWLMENAEIQAIGQEAEGER
ncbi:hypothetical protein LCGC14_1991560 [marine sediment metagenome]|uniref:Uncharacterized protein n=1 Tax=marine sediment metagenome TaxID=412755 RepID=A0A0F9I337_9ZZZZ